MALAKTWLERLCIGVLVFAFELPRFASGKVLQEQNHRRKGVSGESSRRSPLRLRTVANEDSRHHSLRSRIPDLPLLNQDGQRVSFYRDLIEGKVVVINVFFTSCRLVCPMQGEAFSKLQDTLGDRLGKDVFLISVTSDPLSDGPKELKAWSARFGARPGWTLLTGDERTVDKLLVLLTGYVPGRGEHTPAVLILNDEKGKWIREYGLAAPERVLARIDETNREPPESVRK